MHQNEFEKLLAQTETSFLDFKAELYDFRNDRFATDKLVKDIISFSNTIRNQTSRIIFGVSENEDGILKLDGISKTIDDAILQEKVKDKIFPSSVFCYTTVTKDDKIFGIMEFPITKFELPLSATKKLKGIEPGKFYYRRGTSNTEATGLDTIRIMKWLESLPGHTDYNELNEEVSNFIVRLSNQEEKLSIVIPELLKIGKKFNLEMITEFCLVQVGGIKPNSKFDKDYRKQKVYGSPVKADFNDNPYVSVTQNKVRSEMLESEDFYPVKIMFPQPLIELEELIGKFSESSGLSMTIQKSNAGSFFKTDKDLPFYIYCLEDDYKSVYNNIRQLAIDLLMEI